MTSNWNMLKKEEGIRPHIAILGSLLAKACVSFLSSQVSRFAYDSNFTKINLSLKKISHVNMTCQDQAVD